MIGIIDTGVSNIRSVTFALDRIELEYKLVKATEEFNDCDRYIIPGVGNFTSLSQKFSSDFKIAIRETEKPVLGICLGMHFLFNSSEEDSNDNSGLGLLKGQVQKLPIKCLPHMGWNNIQFLGHDQLLKDVSDQEDFYYVHSFGVLSSDYAIAKTEVEGQAFSSIVRYKNFYGVQFHPEKSSKAGQKILFNFSEITC